MDRIEALAVEANGAIQVDEARNGVIKVVVGGAIKHWWAPGQWETPEREIYFTWRDAVRAEFVKSGFLVYSPHRAWQGSWHDDAQRVNDEAIRIADFFVDVSPPGVPKEGTEHEILLARTVGAGIVGLPPGDVEDITRAIWNMKVTYDNHKYRAQSRAAGWGLAR